MPTPLFTGGYGPIASIVNYFSGGGVSYTANSLSAAATNSCKEFLSGALSAGVLATVPSLSLTGRGRVNTLTAYTKDATARTVRCQVIVDGVTIFDATTNSISTSGGGLIPIGSVDGTGSVQQFGQIVYYSSFVVKLASSLSETDKLAAGINYETWA